MTSYKNMEEVLKTINQKYITLNTAEVAYNNQLLKDSLERMISKMQELDPLFKTLYEKPFYGGSFYDDLKVGAPDEFDLDLLLVVPKRCAVSQTRSCSCVNVKESNKPGYFWFKIEQNHCPSLAKFIKDGYMQTDAVLNWIKGLVAKALNGFNISNSAISNYSFVTPSFFSESGPAITLRLYGQFGHMDVDLVPAFRFDSQCWPKNGYRANTSTKKFDFFIVPKKAKAIQLSERYWRASFQDQERELINGKERLKPALRLLKKMRNNLGHSSISSYALKTVTLWNLESFDRKATLSDTFMLLLEKYRCSLDDERVPYYWNKAGNLLDGISRDTLINHHNEIAKKINMIKREFETNPLIVAKIILKEGTEDYRTFVKDYELKAGCSSLPSLDNLSLSGEYGDPDGPDPGQQATTSSGWGTADVLFVIGAAVLAGLTALRATSRNNRD